uniref:Transcription factor CBF/NF-Y/archaeal histone domain-containing protein n=1 Tax=Noctiluca scintillans TaxID=2966 RepID=A0A7S1F2L6_NOCSC
MDAVGVAKIPADDPLSAIGLPASVIRRIVKDAAPGERFSGEAIAAFHRIAQIFVCYLTERSLQEVRVEADKAKRGKKVAPPRRNLSTDHVMRFLTKEFPPIAAKMSSLFPEVLSTEFKPPAIQLLEQLRHQQQGSERNPEVGETFEAPDVPVKTGGAPVSGKHQRQKEDKEGSKKRAKTAGTSSLTSFFGGAGGHAA